jgi:hypothetical protein
LVSDGFETDFRMVMTQRAPEPSDSKIVKLATTEESLETELVYWIRDLVRSYGKLIPALDRLRRSYRELRDSEPVTDCEEALRQVEQALKVAEEFSLLGLAWFRGQRKT